MNPSRIEVRIIRADIEFVNRIALLAPVHAEGKASRFAWHNPALWYFDNDGLRRYV
jgi:hypothetical protein